MWLNVKRFATLCVTILVLSAPLLWAQADGPRVIMGVQNPPPIRVPDDLPPGGMQGKAKTACLECHEARIILQQRLSKAAWTKEVDKMVKWGAVVDTSDRDPLIDYLSTNFSPDTAPYVPPRSEKETGRKTASGTAK